MGLNGWNSLADLPLQGMGRVVRVHGNGPWSDRLRELGFCPGTEVRLDRRAPLGDPLLFTLRGSQLSLRRGEAVRIEVEAPGGGE